MTGSSGPKVSSFMQSISVLTSASSVGSTKDPSRRFPPFNTFAPLDTASDIWWVTWETEASGVEPRSYRTDIGPSAAASLTFSAALLLMSGPWVVSGSEP